MTDLELDRLTEQYVRALRAADFPVLDRLWERATYDLEVESALLEIHDAFDADDRDQADWKVERLIAGSAAKFLTSAEIVTPSSGPVTVGDVARELFRHTPDRLPAEAHQLNQKLETSGEHLPHELGLAKLVAWAEGLFGPASADYWKAFQLAALKLERRRGSAVEYQLAARRAAKPEEPK